MTSTTFATVIVNEVLCFVTNEYGDRTLTVIKWKMCDFFRDHEISSLYCRLRKIKDLMSSSVVNAELDIMKQRPTLTIFWESVWMAPRNHVLDGVQMPNGKGQFWGKGAPIVKYRDFLS